MLFTWYLNHRVLQTLKIAVECADEAVQMHGGYGYIDEYKFQRLYRDAKILEIYEGTKEMEKIIIAGTLLGKDK